ncbi:Methylmalonyl-CoA epimerase, mitochondrial [Toxocara canis]|uniref:Methylmalonyl-CoA epimerase, mitochondrial n=1 Tax=Toxocara canis TaxID=6265 RepID=A0A0B2V4B6_TOXCA|nr:Methylmalonyl-CoA epimerase, mitochondrial [Toxocara canis]
MNCTRVFVNCAATSVRTIAVRNLSAHPLAGLLGRLNHVAIITPDIDKSRKFYINLGATVSEKKAVPEWGVETAFVELPNTKIEFAVPEWGVQTAFVELPNTKIEFVYPYADDSPVMEFLVQNPKGGLHHICVEVSNIHKAIAEVRKLGIRTKGDEPKIGAHGKPVIFLNAEDTDNVNIELEEA